ncbi:MAG: glycosyltransferase [Bacteroidota bacterium]|jgi:cellulose synthase/poly-beta-1,6-N-acetylglucosamine synthase-like glycosyltransferase|nr:glycosyltransferase [Bacteroidota bacterium]
MFDQVLYFITIIACILCSLYVVVFACLSYGWEKTTFWPKQNATDTNVCVIIAARNEKGKIEKLLNALISQNYPKSHTEIIVVDDHSDDHTSEIVMAFMQKHFNIKLIKANGSGKKNAIAEAISKTEAELIVTTDADCTMGPEWLQTIVSFYCARGSQMIVSPVMFQKENTLSEKLQTLEFLALMGSTGGSLYFNKTIICNGANLAYTREAFYKADGFNEIDQIVSGDDVLLMYKLRKLYPDKINFLKNDKAIVYTEPKHGIKDFVSQRRRWASKGMKLLSKEAVALSLIVYFFSFFLLLMAVLSPFARSEAWNGLGFWQICLILGGIKCIIDFLLLFLAAGFFKRRGVLFLFLPGQIIYLFYVVVIGMLGNMGNFEWKGRKY